MCSVKDIPNHLWHASVPCVFFQRGNCKRGDDCWYLHAHANCEVTLTDAIVYVESLDKNMKRYALEQIAHTIGKTTRCKLHSAKRYGGLQSAHVHFTSVGDANAFILYMDSRYAQVYCQLYKVNKYTFFSPSTNVSTNTPTAIYGENKEEKAISPSTDELALESHDELALESHDELALESHDELALESHDELALESNDEEQLHKNITESKSNRIIAMDQLVITSRSNLIDKTAYSDIPSATRLKVTH